jgi:hypothetical protein
VDGLIVGFAPAELKLPAGRDRITLHPVEGSDVTHYIAVLKDSRVSTPYH